MRKLFPGYYNPSEEETTAQWEEGTFVFDTSVLLNLYSYPEQAREEFLDILEELADRTWLPYQVMLEFHRNRNSRIGSANRAVLDLKSSLQKTIQSTKEGFSSIQFEKRNTDVLDIEKRIADFDSSGKSLLEALEKAAKKLNRVGLADEIVLRLSAMYEDRVGSPPKDQVELDKLLEGADDRFEKRIPPGFADLKDKTAIEYHAGIRYETKYGDLVVWRQLIEHVKAIPNSRVVLVTAERKNDFWLKDEKDKDRIIGPLPELIHEFLSETNAASFWLYSAEDFLQQAKTRGDKAVSTDTINEVRDISLMYDVMEGELDLADEIAMSTSINKKIRPVASSSKVGEIVSGYLASRFPSSKVRRIVGGWCLINEDIYIESLHLESIDVTLISKHLSGMFETVLYAKVILVILIPIERWELIGDVAFLNFERYLRKVMVAEGVFEIVILAHDELLSLVDSKEILAVEI